MRLALLIPLALAVSASACDQAPPVLAPIGNPELRLDLGVVGQLTPGSVVRFRISAVNTTGESIRVGDLCGPPLDVRVYSPSHDWVSLATGMGPEGTSDPCPPSPEQFVAAGETMVVEYDWTVPEVRGRYSAYGSVRRRTGSPYSTPPLPVNVL
jgi:hypothetical protein